MTMIYMQENLFLINLQRKLRFSFLQDDLEVINELTKHLKEVKFAKSKANKKSFKTVFYFPDSPIRKRFRCFVFR